MRRDDAVRLRRDPVGNGRVHPPHPHVPAPYAVALWLRRELARLLAGSPTQPA